ncbi:MAG: hypothetical protein KA138_00105 [Saprospiraceae bacterium]|nr:hypothetical protein [Saprospiraceae bacterium]
MEVTFDNKTKRGGEDRAGQEVLLETNSRDFDSDPFERAMCMAFDEYWS